MKFYRTRLEADGGLEFIEEKELYSGVPRRPLGGIGPFT